MNTNGTTSAKESQVKSPFLAEKRATGSAPKIDTQANMLEIGLLPPQSVVEIQGSAACGKTHLLYHLLLMCITPQSARGWDKAAILYDSDQKFSIRRFRRLARARLLRSCVHLKDVDAEVDRCFAKLHIFAPKSSQQLAVSLLHLPAYHERYISEDTIGLLAIDSLCAFYWQDKAMFDCMRDFDRGYKPPIDHVISALKSLRSSYGSIMVWTYWAMPSILEDVVETSKSRNTAAVYPQRLKSVSYLTSQPPYC